MKADYFRENTIAAILCAQNEMSAVGIIRLSGERAFSLASKVAKKFKNKEEFSPHQVQSHKLYRTKIVDRQGALLDDGVFIYLKAPHSFTGENTVELQLHGSPYLLKKVMQELLHFGAEEALPGEFSFRAFRNGRLRLDQAESIAELIKAQSNEGLQRASAHLLGDGQSEINRLKKILVNALAQVEVDIDFSDQGLSSLDYFAWKKELENWCEELERTRAEFIRTQPLREGIKVAFYGAPNAGKSSLFNKILGENRSIVSHEAGTTRDVVSESLYLDGLLLRLLDTAGDRFAESDVEAQGIQKTHGEASGADILLWILDGEKESSSSVDEIAKRVLSVKSLGARASILVLWNKSDVSAAPSMAWKIELERNNLPILPISAKTGLGLPDLKVRIKEKFQFFGPAPSFLISRTRHFEVLGSCINAVKRAIQRVEKKEIFPDVLASDLREAIHCFGELTGEFSSEELLRHIFSEFCIGK